MTGDLFDPNRTMMTKESIAERALGKKAPGRNGRGKRKGYPAKPGTGPEGETCGSCVFKVTPHKKFIKCHKIKRTWNYSWRTDIEARFPACSYFKAPSPELIALRKAEKSAKRKMPTGYSYTGDGKGGWRYYYYPNQPMPAEKVALIENWRKLSDELDALEKKELGEPL